MRPNGDLIKALRSHFNMSQADLAAAAQVSLATIFKLESGALKNPKLSTLNAVANVFEIRTTQLLYTETPEPSNYKLVQEWLR